MREYESNVLEAALSAGYEIVSSRGPSCIELAGNGDWMALQQACVRFVERTKYTHVSVIVQSEDGKRELRDVGTCGQWTAEQLQSVSFCHQVASRTERTETLLGVYPSHGSFSARVQTGEKGRRKFVYLGLYKDRMEAAKVRDRYVIEFGVKTPLNFKGA
jgi:hypothetical protein